MSTYWNYTLTLTSGTLAKAEDINTLMSGVDTGLAAVETDMNKCIQITNGAGVVDVSLNAAARANKIVGFDANGDVVATQDLGTWQGDHANAAGTAYNLRDIVKDAAASLGLNNLYICITAHTSTGSLSTDTANWELLFDASVNNVAITRDGDANQVGGTGAGASLVSSSALRNILIGEDAGNDITTGDDNIAIGYRAIDKATTGTNLGIGQNAGRCITTGDQNIFIGVSAGFDSAGALTGDDNIAAGALAMGGGAATSAHNNICIGNNTLRNITSGHNNVVLGQEAGNDITTGFSLVLIGQDAGDQLTDANYIVGIGDGCLGNSAGSLTDVVAIGRAAGGNLSGDGNVVIGAGAGTSITGTYNTVIGAGAGTGQDAATAGAVFIGGASGGTGAGPSSMNDVSNELFIHNGQTDYPLIWGDFSNRELAIHGSLTLADSSGVIPALANSATPSVTGISLARSGGTTTITDLTGGKTGQILTILAEHSITITDGTNLFLHGSANFAMASTDSLTVVQKADGNWYEISRAVS